MPNWNKAYIEIGSNIELNKYRVEIRGKKSKENPPSGTGPSPKLAYDEGIKIRQSILK